MALTDTFVKSLKSPDKPTRYRDGDGLYLKVTPQGSRLWRMAFSFLNKQKKLAFGKYPDVTLAEARQKRGQVKTLVAKGVDPSDVARQEKQPLEFSMFTWKHSRREQRPVLCTLPA